MIRNIFIIGMLVIGIGNVSSCNYNALNSKSENLENIEKMIDITDTATFGNGCFWCTEAIFTRLKGVVSVMPGYSGGTTKNPKYKEVTSGVTGHAEVIQIYFNRTEISFDELLEVFWSTHDPTTLNRQGADVGTQYRSAIFYHNAEQREKAEKYKIKLNEQSVFNDPIVTEITEISGFYKAEDYHRNYYKENPNQGYCQFVIVPKIKKFEKIFADKLKD